MKQVLRIAKREFASYFASPLAVVFLVIFLIAAGALTFEWGGFLGRGQADLSVFFALHPWLYVILMPAIGMRLWAEERRSGTVEFLLTLPILAWEAVLGKFLAAWLFAGLALALTFPIWITVNYLGDPDNGVILASYLGSFLMGGAFLALACCISALTRNQVIAFVLGVAAGFVMLMSSLDPVTSVLESRVSPMFVDLIASLSFTRHFEAITRGVLDLRNLLFFLSFIVLMLFLNRLVLDGKRVHGRASRAGRRGLGALPAAGGAAVLALALFLSLNFLSLTHLGAMRVDLTERRLFTLHDRTRAELAAIEEPLRLRLYRTRELTSSVPDLQVFERQILELLQNFADIGNGRVEVEVIDVLPFSVEEDEALGYDLHGIPLGSSGERGYFGLVGTNSLDGLEVIPFLAPNRGALLQYDLAQMVHRLKRPDEPKVSIIDGLGMFGSMSEGRQPWAMLDMIGANFAIERVAQNAEAIPAETDVLMITHPVRLPEPLLKAIDTYVNGGGTAIVFLDPLSEHSAPSPVNPAVPLEPSSELEPLLASWGLSMDPALVVGDSNMAISITGAAGNQRVVAPYLPWLRVDSAALDPDDLITSQLNLMRVSSAGALQIREDATTNILPLIQSTEDSMLMERSWLLERPNPNALIERFAPSGERQILAARITGPARPAYPEAAGIVGTPSKEGVNMIVVADTDLLANSHVVGPEGRLSTSNSDFVLNALEALSGSDALAEVRRGGIAYRPFTTVEALRARAENQYRATEQRLNQELEDVQAELQRLQTAPGQAGDALAVSREQQETIAEFNRRSLELRQQLRDVRAALRGEMAALESRLRFVNILMVPLALVLLAALAAGWRRVRLAGLMRRHAGRREQNA